MRTVAICSDGKPAVDIGPDTETESHEGLQLWFKSAQPNDVAMVTAKNATVLIQKRHVVRIEVYP